VITTPSAIVDCFNPVFSRPVPSFLLSQTLFDSRMTTLFQLLLLTVLCLSHAFPSYAQFKDLCDLESATGTVYSLDSLETLTTSTIVKLPTTGSPVYNKGYINFCEPATTQCGAGVFACLTSPTTKVPLALCTEKPTGKFIFAESPQVGATFSCPSTSGTPALNGVVSSATPVQHFHSRVRTTNLQL
jgi:hypothetical protein